MSQPISPPPPPAPPSPLSRVQVVCKWAVAVCVCGAGSNKCTILEFQIAMTLSLSNSFIMTKKPFPYIILLLEQFNMLQFSISLCLKCVLVIGHCVRRNIKVSSVKNPELTNVFPHSSGAVWESRWTSWAVRPNEPSGFRGRKELLNRASALITTCP